MTDGARRTVLITGAGGFIGSALLRRLRAEGHRVIGTDLPAIARRAQPEQLLGHDLTTPLPPRALRGVDVVIHGAALAGVQASWSAPAQYWRANAIASRRLRKACEQAEVRRVVHLSSISVYGEGLRLDERCPAAPVSPYGRSKRAAELAWDRYPGATVVRLSNVYGPGQRPDMAYATFIRAALAGRRIELRDGGRQFRTPTYIDDCVEGILAALERGGSGAVYNIAGPEDIRLADVPRLLERLLRQAVPVQAVEPARGDPRTATVSTARARRALGFSATTSLAEGLPRQLAAAPRDRAPVAATA